MNLNLTDDNFCLEDQYSNERKLNQMDLQITFKDFYNKGGKFVIVDIS